LAIGHLLFAVVAMAGCASAPVYPDPIPGQGQLLVELKGIPREGVKGPKQETIRDEYSSHTESVEKGKAFERVKYDKLRDVLVVLEDAAGKTIARHEHEPAIPTLILGPKGFACAQYGADPMILSTVEVTNTRDSDVDLMADGSNGQFKVVHAPAGKTVDLELDPGVYELTCDADESTLCRVIVTETGFIWRGTSDDAAFWAGLEPGEYNLAIYAPRLPVVHKTVTVESGKRATGSAELTVNHLPKAR
jgi:hypothetical protein